jgi:hypothetical protein
MPEGTPSTDRAAPWLRRKKNKNMNPSTETQTYQIKKLSPRGNAYIAETDSGQILVDHADLSSIMGGKRNLALCAAVTELSKTSDVLIDAQGRLVDRIGVLASLRAFAKIAKTRKPSMCSCANVVPKGARVLLHAADVVVGCSECADVAPRNNGNEAAKDSEHNPTRVVLEGAYEDCNANVDATRKALRAFYVDRKEAGRLGSLYVLGEEPGKAGKLHFLREHQGVVGGESITDAPTLYLLMKNLEFVRPKADKNTDELTFKPVAPPDRIAQHILRFGNDRLPRLKGLVRLPTLTTRGEILTTKGYDAESELFSDPSVKIEPVNDITTSDLSAATALIDDLLHDFPFAYDGAKAAAVAVLLEQCVRHALIDGPCPAYSIVAPDPKTGKSLLAEISQIILQGSFKPTSWTNDPNELDKRLLPLLLEGDPAIVFDNVNGEINSPHIAMLITAPVYVGRRLGQSKMESAPNRSTVVFTSNNATFTGEVARRIITVSLDERKRTTPRGADGNFLFRHRSPSLREWAKRNRAAIIRALLVMAKSWMRADSPPDPSLVDLPSFETWSRVVGGILYHAGYRGLGRAVYEAQEERNADRDRAAELLRALYAVHQFDVFRTRNIGAAVISAGLADQFGYGSGSTNHLDPLTVGKRVKKDFLAELKRWPVRVASGVVQLVDAGDDGHSSPQYRLDPIGGPNRDAPAVPTIEAKESSREDDAGVDASCRSIEASGDSEMDDLDDRSELSIELDDHSWSG